MYRKQSIAARVYNIAEQQGIYQTTVHTIISSYIDYCKVLLLSGHKVDFFGIATIVPDVIVDDYNTTLSYDCSRLAEQLHLPYNTVFIIIREYLYSIMEDIFLGRNAEIRGIVTMKPIKEDGVICKVHASMSVSLKNLIDSSDCVISSARVHTYKLLRSNLKK